MHPELESALRQASELEVKFQHGEITRKEYDDILKSAYVLDAYSNRWIVDSHGTWKVVDTDGHAHERIDPNAFVPLMDLVQSTARRGRTGKPVKPSGEWAESGIEYFWPRLISCAYAGLGALATILLTWAVIVTDGAYITGGPLTSNGKAAVAVTGAAIVALMALTLASCLKGAFKTTGTLMLAPAILGAGMSAQSLGESNLAGGLGWAVAAGSMLYAAIALLRGRGSRSDILRGVGILAFCLVAASLAAVVAWRGGQIGAVAPNGVVVADTWGAPAQADLASSSELLAKLISADSSAQGLAPNQATYRLSGESLLEEIPEQAAWDGSGTANILVEDSRGTCVISLADEAGGKNTVTCD